MQRLNLNLPKKREVVLPASVLKRFASYILDFLILNVILYPINNSINKIIPSEKGFEGVYSYIQSNPLFTKMLLFYSMIVGAIIVLYFTYFEFKTNQTPGKMLMNLHIIPDGKKQLGFFDYLLSNLTFIPTFPFVILWILDPLWIIFSKNNQRFMEKISHIKVVERHEVY